MNPGFAFDLSALRNRVKSPGLLSLIHHWELVRASRRMPSWSDLSPGAMAPYLTQLWAFRYDRQSGEFIGKLAGNRIMLAAGQGFQGTPLRALHLPHTYERARANLTRIVTEPAAYRCNGPLFRIGDKLVEGERIVLPLAADGRLADAVIGASEYQLPMATGAVEMFADDLEWYSL